MSSDTPQYQHFIPQFILKNIDYPFSCPKTPTNGSKCKKHHHEKGKYPGDRVVDCLELLPEGYKVEERSVRRVCGLDDMYTDQSPSAKFPRELEAKFSKLEGETSLVVRKIIGAYQRGEANVKITRTQQAVLRNIDDYKKNDRDLLKEFMDRNGIQRPLDVWLQALSSIIDLDMRVTANWQQTLKSTVYYGLFCHFVEHITEFWMSFCTPSSEDQEFILSDTGSHIEIDSIHGPGTKSILEDLPVHKAINSYSTLVNGTLRKRPGWDGQLRQTDTFSFPFSKISTRHARIINGLLLDHAFHGLTVIFNKKTAFLDLLEWFLTEPCEVGKRLGGEHHAEQMRYLSRLTTLMHAEGRNISLCITNGPVSNHLDMEGYQNQNNAAARWLESHEKKDASEGAAKQKQRQGPDTEVDAVQHNSTGLQDQPKNEKGTIEGQLTDHGPTLKHEEELSQAELTSLHTPEFSTRHQSANVQRAHPKEQLLITVGVIVFSWW
ncbi:hypothetical protein FPHYL_9391 [Fusarium phyllophilum]|uniref:Uncharacterized protein n=1 Tax=Fusarium phyllophilum TaxID=47803 RepID=A0A8H5N1R0_9HYPO|nr:hypothetical protein FPHYL_9391 [Fusarium phyllophilum]